MTNIINDNNVFDGLFSYSLLWEESHQIAQELENNPNKWVHFTDLPKLGVNPQKGHKDPFGIYFYPAKWLLDNYSGFQYGMSKPNAYLVDIKMDGQNGLNLGSSWGTVKSIAKQNGWLKYLELAKNNPKKYLSEGPMDSSNWKRPGGIFYATADALANTPEVFNTSKKTWGSLVGGLDYIYDPGYGIIAKDESEQIVVINQSIIQNKQHFDNRDMSYKILNKMAFEIVEKLGGESHYENKKVIGNLNVNGSQIKIIFNLPNYFRFNIISYQNGILFNEKLHLSGYEWGYPYELQMSSIIYKINKYLENNPPEKNGIELKWNYETISSLIESCNIQLDHVRDYVSDGKYVLGGHSYRTYYEFKTDKSNKISMDVEDIVEKKYRPFEYRKTFDSNASIEDIVNDFKSSHKEWIQEYKTRLFNKEFEDDNIDQSE